MLILSARQTLTEANQKQLVKIPLLFNFNFIRRLSKKEQLFSIVVVVAASFIISPVLLRYFFRGTTRSKICLFLRLFLPSVLSQSLRE